MLKQRPAQEMKTRYNVTGWLASASLTLDGGHGVFSRALPVLFVFLFRAFVNILCLFLWRLRPRKKLKRVKRCEFTTLVFCLSLLLPSPRNKYTRKSAHLFWGSYRPTMRIGALAILPPDFVHPDSVWRGSALEPMVPPLVRLSGPHCRLQLSHVAPLLLLHPQSSAPGPGAMALLVALPAMSTPMRPAPHTTKTLPTNLHMLDLS